MTDEDSIEKVMKLNSSDVDSIEFICVVKDGKFVYYPVFYSRELGGHKVELNDNMICHFNDIEKSGGFCPE